MPGLLMRHPETTNTAVGARYDGREEVENSSGAGARPSGLTVAGSPRPAFISYASHDVVVAQKVCAALEAAGFLCWIALPGMSCLARCMRMALFTRSMSRRSWCSSCRSTRWRPHVGREIERAVSKRHPVVALRIDAAPLTAAFEYFLNQSQWVRPDAFSTRLNVASDRPNDGTGMYRLGGLARDGVVLARNAFPAATARNGNSAVA